MKLSDKERVELSDRLMAESHRRGLRHIDLAELSGVDASQVSRICRGEFRTVSGNVMQICNLLGVQPLVGARRPSASQGIGLPAGDAAWEKLEQSLRRAWDKTPTGADRLAKVIAAIADVLER